MTKAHFDEGHVGGYWGRAGSGFLFTTGPKILLLLRAPWVMEGGTWGIPGGAIPVDMEGRPMNALASAKREVREEMGRVPGYTIIDRYVFRDDASGASPRSGGGAVAKASRGGKTPANETFTFTTFVALVDREFRPTLNDESEDFVWWDPDTRPPAGGLHFGVAALLEHVRRSR